MGKCSHEQFVKKFKYRQPENYEKYELLTEYKGSLETILCRCKNCNIKVREESVKIDRRITDELRGPQRLFEDAVH